MSLLSDLRLDIGDDGSQTPGSGVYYSDTQLIGFLTKSARRTNRELNLFGTTNQIVMDVSGNITSPSDNGALEDIVLLQAECMLTQRQSLESASNNSADGILMIDGEQQLDTRQRAAMKLSALESKNNPCSQLRAAINDYLLDQCFGIDVW